MSNLENLVSRAETVLGSRGPQWESDAEQIIQDLVAAMKDDIVAIKEYAPKYLGERVDQYRKRTHAAEEIVQDARETLEGYSRWWDESPEDGWRLERDLRAALQMPELEF